MNDLVVLRAVEADDLPIFFAHQLDPEATRMAAFPSRDREAFMAHWRTKILGNPLAKSRTLLHGGRVAGNIGSWTDAETSERLLCYWLGREFWGRGIATAAVAQFLTSESRPIGARVVSHNHGSIRVLEKSGFVHTGEERFTQADGANVEEFVYLLAE